jgi:hypothetical protein
MYSLSTRHMLMKNRSVLNFIWFSTIDCRLVWLWILGPKKRGFFENWKDNLLQTLFQIRAYPPQPPADTMSMAAVAMVPPWKIVEILQSQVKNANLWPSCTFHWRISLTNKVKRLTLVCLTAYSARYILYKTPILASLSTEEQHSHHEVSHEWAPQNH